MEREVWICGGALTTQCLGTAGWRPGGLGRAAGAGRAGAGVWGQRSAVLILNPGRRPPVRGAQQDALSPYLSLGNRAGVAAWGSLPHKSKIRVYFWNVVDVSGTCGVFCRTPLEKVVAKSCFNFRPLSKYFKG